LILLLPLKLHTISQDPDSVLMTSHLRHAHTHANNDSYSSTNDLTTNETSDAGIAHVPGNRLDLRSRTRSERALDPGNGDHFAPSLSQTKQHTYTALHSTRLRKTYPAQQQSLPISRVVVKLCDDIVGVQNKATISPAALNRHRHHHISKS
jgi:hypothetical protein